MIHKKFFLIDAEAAEDIVSTRMLQSDDFEDGKLLGVLLRGGPLGKARLTAHTCAIDQGDGVYLLHDKSDHSNFLVVDQEKSQIFSCSSEKDALLRLQKLLRFCRRRWTNTVPAINERIIPGSTKGILFPYPITSQSSFRITVELAPDQRRRERRAKGMEMLAYTGGFDEGGGPHEEAPVANFRRAVEGLPAAASAVLKQASEARETRIESLSVTKLQPGTVTGAISGCNLDEWRQYLTQTQRAFVESELKSAHRIEGPAGTGKTLSLVLKCIWNLRHAQALGKEYRALFVAHSDATRRTIQEIFAPDISAESDSERLMALQSVKVTTLQALCSDFLRYEISETEFLDRDAFESKQAQMLYTVQALERTLDNDLPSHRPHLSSTFANFLTTNDVWFLAEVMQHEISVMIKGRADEELEKYKRLPRLSYGLPTESDGDKSFAFLVFRTYQDSLKSSGQFDTDDVVLSALGQLDTPIWRRRREREGYDGIFVDETHLFNINELSVFHRLTRSPEEFPIAYSADVSQSLGDRGWGDVDFTDALYGFSNEAVRRTDETVFASIFRCSPDIVNLAFSVTSAGATLFTNFQDPLAAASSTFTDEEERKCAKPEFRCFVNDQAMIEGAFAAADELAGAMGVNRGDVAIVVFGTDMFSQVEKFARTSNKPVEVVKHRGDFDVVKRARNSGRFVLSTPDYVGGLEFAAVVLVGVDKGRVPPRLDESSPDSENFISYATHQRLYVAITRARYRLVLLGLKVRGPSDMLANAIAHDILDIREC